MTTMHHQAVKHWLKSWVRQVLATTTRPIPRGELVTHAAAALRKEWPRPLKYSTITREMRRAIYELQCDGIPILSDGTGFRVAQTDLERKAAAAKLRKAGLACMARAATIMRIPLEGEAHQQSLFEVSTNAET